MTRGPPVPPSSPPPLLLPPLLLHVFPTFAVGGAQVRFAAVANHFGPAWRHAIVAMDGNLACRERLDPGLLVDFPAAPVRKGDTLGNVRRCRALLGRLAPHALVTSNWGSIEWAMANAWPIARHIHIEDGFGPEERARQLPRRVWARRLLLRRSLVVLPSRTLQRIALEQWRLPPGRVRYLPNGIDLDRFAASGRTGKGAAFPPHWPPHWPPDAPVVGTVAALRAEKNLARLLRAFAAQDAAARLVIVGEGAERAALTALADALGLSGRVHFTGHLDQPDAVYRHLDVFALSSDTEQMPLSVLEAMAAGLPVAATDVGDVAAMLAAANRPFVGRLDDASLAAGLRALLADAALRRAIGAANRAKAVAEYDQDVMFAAYGALLEGQG